MLVTHNAAFLIDRNLLIEQIMIKLLMTGKASLSLIYISSKNLIKAL